MRYLALSLVVILLAGCASSRVEERRAEYVSNYDLDKQTERAIRDGRVLQGMYPEEVFASIGEYDRRNTTVAGQSRQVQLVYEVGRTGQAYVYLDGSNRVVGYQNICQLPFSCR